MNREKMSELPQHPWTVRVGLAREVKSTALRVSGMVCHEQGMGEVHTFAKNEEKERKRVREENWKART
jgi:hypothetical protein